MSIIIIIISSSIIIIIITRCAFSVLSGRRIVKSICVKVSLQLTTRKLIVLLIAFVTGVNVSLKERMVYYLLLFFFFSFFFFF